MCHSEGSEEPLRNERRTSPPAKLKLVQHWVNPQASHQTSEGRHHLISPTHHHPATLPVYDLLFAIAGSLFPATLLAGHLCARSPRARARPLRHLATHTAQRFVDQIAASHPPPSTTRFHAQSHLHRGTSRVRRCPAVTNTASRVAD